MIWGTSQSQPIIFPDLVDIPESTYNISQLNVLENTKELLLMWLGVMVGMIVMLKMCLSLQDT